MDAAIASGEIQLSEHGPDGARISWTTYLTSIKLSFVDKRILTEAGFSPCEDPEYYILSRHRKVKPEEVEEWVRRTTELRETDLQMSPEFLDETRLAIEELDEDSENVETVRPADMWDCPNPEGGCEGVSNPGWQEFCPICGEPKPAEKTSLLVKLRYRKP